MSGFKHSIVLFTGDDGLPLEFNVRNTNEKAHLKALIEHGGGFCTQNENSVHLISPGTKVLNVDLGKKLVSSSYIYDCVKQNYLLDVNEYVFTISEAQTSDISDEDSERLLAQRQSTCKSPNKNIPTINMEISPIKQPNVSDETTPSNLSLPLSNSTMPPPINSSSESFIEGTQEASKSYKITSHVYYGNDRKLVNEKIESSEGLRENSEDFNLSQSIVSLPKPKDTLNDNLKNHCLASEQNDLLVDACRNHLNPLSPSKQTVDDVIKNHMKSPLPPKRQELFIESTKIPPSVHSPIKSTFNAPTTSTQNTIGAQKNKIFSSPKRQIDISPIMRADIKKITKNCINQRLELPIKNPFRKEQGETLEKDINTNDMDINDNFEHENLLLPPASPGKNSQKCPLDENEIPLNMSAVNIVSSSQTEDDLDTFDNMLLSKALHKTPSEDEGSVSQTCTVSSSADAQVSSKPCSSDDNVPPFQVPNADNLPDSPNLSLTEIEEEEYIRKLEIEVQEILQKPSPRTIQDKIMLVKYICCVRKLAPRIVLESLLSKNNSLDLEFEL